MKKRLGIDIDGTVTCPSSLIPHINRAFNRSLTLEDIKEYDLTKALPDIHPSRFSEWFQETEADIYRSSPIHNDADEVLTNWKKEFELFFISARGGQHLELTKKWFDEQEIDYDHIELIGSHNKLDAVDQHNIDLFLEDKHDNAVMIHEAFSIPVILFDTPYNQDPIPDGVIRVRSWAEAHQWVMQWEKALKKSLR
ncbi:5' nucleotidase, NT5C type [Jeotgalibacillus aurantiacus]|uniref:5' nucleotidase, NT5C type n=1 Tax=Jeotgalibacillus aurantiacus TaxID=2763266 RepID=UPI001D0B60B4|nr:hypothetical protein [Jeotgalibacillus aurantiacus]